VNDANTGGAQTLIEQLAQELCGSVESHVLVLLGRGSLSRRFAECASSVTYLDLDKKSMRVDVLVGKTRQVIRTISPDVVHSHLLQSDLAVALASVGLRVGKVSTIHTTGMTAEDPLRSRLLGKLLGSISNRLIDKSVACGSSALSYMRQNGYNLTKAITINNGVELPAAPVRGPGLRNVLVSLSRWHPMKDHDNLFRAFVAARKENPSLRLLCAGGGVDDANSALKALVLKWGISDSVTLLGSVQEVRRTLRAADALVISSSYGEALPMAGLEALGEGVPVITTDVGDCRNLTIHPWQCVPPGDPLALADAISKLYALTEADSWELLCRSYKRAQEDYSIVSTGRSYLKVYKEAARTSEKLNDAI
jgi:glycosyltransferase involved in cell wall biosynthesis